MEYHLLNSGLKEIENFSRKFHTQFEPFNKLLYLELFPRVNESIQQNVYKTAFDHFCAIGYSEILDGKRKWPSTKKFHLFTDKRNIDLNEYNLLINEYDGLVPMSEFYQKFEIEDIKNGVRQFHQDFSPYDNKLYYDKYNNDLNGMSSFEHFTAVGCKEIIEGKRFWSKTQGLKEEKKEIFFSIIMPTYNRKNLIDIAIESVVNQTYTQWELLITDDHSNDGTVEYLNDQYKSLIDKNKIKVFINDEKGVCSARNRSLAEVHGNVVAYLDSDNFWERNYLEKLNSVYKYNDSLDCVYTAIRVIDRNQNKDFVRAVPYNRKELLAQNYIDMNIFSHKSNLITKHGPFNTTMNRLVDYELIVRYTRHNQPYFLNEVLASYIFDKSNNQISDIDSYEINTNIFKELNKLEMKLLGLNPKDNYLSIAEKVDINKIKNDTLPWDIEREKVANRVSIIIPVYNNIELTIKCIESIINKTIYDDYEIVVVDNYSTDTTADVFHKLLELHSENNIKYVQNNFNYGYSVGNNIGFFHSTGEYILLLNNDMEVLTHGWLNQFVNTLNSDDISIVGPKLLYPDETVQCAGIAFNNVNCMPYHIFQHRKRTDPVINKERVLNATTGACMFMRANEYQSVGGLSPEYLNGGEDVDLCFKIYEAFGKKVKYIPTVELIHHESKSEGRSIAIEYNREILYEKWLKKVQPRDDMLIFAKEGLIIDEYKKNKHDKNNHTAIYLPRMMDKLPFFLKSAEGKKTITSIIVFKPSGIGNMIMFTPALTAIKEMYTNAKITVACYAADSKIIEDAVDDVIILKKDPVTGAFNPDDLEEIIKKEDEYQVAVYPQFTNFGRPTKYLRSIISYHITFSPVDYTVKHEVLHNMDVAYKLGWDKVTPDMWTPVDENFKVKKRVKDAIVVHVGASDTVHMQKKKWPEEKWVKLLNALPKDEKIVFVGGENETKDIDRVISELNPDRKIKRYDGKLNIKETASVINAGKMMISTDSGLMHMAAALKKPLIAIFGPTLLSKNSAWGEGFPKYHIASTVECAPCYADPKKLFECPDAICMKEIEADVVLDAVNKILEEI